MTTPAGLASFKRSMITKFAGTCEWCGSATKPGIDYAALGGDGKWFASCAACSASNSARVAGVCNRIAMVQDQLTAEQLATLDAIPAELAEAIRGNLSDRETILVLAHMVAMRRMIDDLLAAGKPAVRKGRPNRYAGKCAHCEFQVEAGQGIYSNGQCSHTVCPTFEEWCMAKYGALPGSPELREIAVQHGTETSHCIFCGLTLDHPDSDPRQGGVGYGPVCAVKYGLPHGGSGKR